MVEVLALNKEAAKSDWDQVSHDVSNQSDSLSDKLAREADLLISGTAAGVRQAALEAWENKPEALIKLGVAFGMGFGMTLLQSRAGYLRLGAQIAGTGLAAAFVMDVAGRASSVGRAVQQTWNDRDTLGANKQIIADTLGPFVVDSAMMTGAGMLGARAARIPAVNDYFGGARKAGQDRARMDALFEELRQKSDWTAEHGDRVARLSRMIGEEMKLPQRRLDALEASARMHDIGKIDVPNQILNKAGALTANERAMIQTHATSSEQLLNRVIKSNKFTDVPRIAGSHHEHWDGSGYPRGLRDTKIPLESRIISVADAFDASTSNRPYNVWKSTLDVYGNIAADANTAFDPAVIKAFGELSANKVFSVVGSSWGVNDPAFLSRFQGTSMASLNAGSSRAPVFSGLLRRYESLRSTNKSLGLRKAA